MRPYSVKEIDDIWGGRLQRVSVSIPRIPWQENREKEEGHEQDEQRLRGTGDPSTPRRA